MSSALKGEGASEARGRTLRLLWLAPLLLGLSPLLALLWPTPASRSLNGLEGLEGLEGLWGRLEARLPERCERVALYMGYPGCQTECPAALSLLAERERRGALKSCVLFVNLLTDEEAARKNSRELDPAQRYLNAFSASPCFVGLTPTPQELARLKESLSARSTRLREAGAPQGPLISHPDLVWLLQREGEGEPDQADGAWSLTGFSSPQLAP